MSQKTCPINHQLTEPQLDHGAETGWYKKIAQQWRHYFLLLFAVIYSLALTFKAKYFLLPQSTAGLALLTTILCFTIALWGYCRQVRRRFSTDRKKIPSSGVLRTLYDVLLRQKTLLRDIDIERLHKLGNLYVMFAGLRPAIVVTSSEMAKEISNDYELYNKSDPRELNMPFFFEWVGNNNVVLANGKKWEKLRNLTHHAVNEVNIFVPIFDEKAKLLVKAFDHELEATELDKGCIPLTRWLKAVSLDSAGVALFGFDFNHLQEITNPGIEAMDYIINEIFNPLRIAFPVLNRMPLKSNRKLKKSMKHLDALVLEMIAKINNDVDSKEMNNVLEMLIRGQQEEILSANDLRNNILALVLASHETTQVSLSASLYYLAKYPEHQERLRQESALLFPNLEDIFQSVGDGSLDKNKNSVYRKLQTFHSMGNFILECLRLYSPLANQNPRTTTNDTTLGGYPIPKGTLVIINIHAIHMSGKEWDNPTVFEPNRFNKGTCPNKYAYLPFGAGPRICSGRSFSLIEQKIILCHLLRNFEIKLPSKEYQVPLLRGSFTGLPSDDYHLEFTRLK